MCPVISTAIRSAEGPGLSWRTAPRREGGVDAVLPIDGHDDAVQMIRRGAMRRMIVRLHEILKSGGRAEQARLSTAERRIRPVAPLRLPSGSAFGPMMCNRIKPDFECALALGELEMAVLDRLIPDPTCDPRAARARLLHRTAGAHRGGRLARAREALRGSIIMRRGLGRLDDITLGTTVHDYLVGSAEPARTTAEHGPWSCRAGIPDTDLEWATGRDPSHRSAMSANSALRSSAGLPLTHLYHRELRLSGNSAQFRQFSHVTD